MPRVCQANQTLFWSYYYSTLAVVILLLLIKSNPRNFDDNFDSFQVTNRPFSTLLQCSEKPLWYTASTWDALPYCFTPILLPSMIQLNEYRKNSNIIRTLVQYAPRTLTKKSWENVSLAVQHAPVLLHLMHTCSLTQTALLSESVACRRQICRPANVGGGDHPGRGGSGDEPGGRIAARDTAESRGRRREMRC